MSQSTPSLPEFEEIAETMSYLPDLDAKYQFLIDLSKRLRRYDCANGFINPRHHRFLVY